MPLTDMRDSRDEDLGVQIVITAGCFVVGFWSFWGILTGLLWLWLTWGLIRRRLWALRSEVRKRGGVEP